MSESIDATMTEIVPEAVTVPDVSVPEPEPVVETEPLVEEEKVVEKAADEERPRKKSRFDPEVVPAAEDAPPGEELKEASNGHEVPAGEQKKEDQQAEKKRDSDRSSHSSRPRERNDRRNDQRNDQPRSSGSSNTPYDSRDEPRDPRTEKDVGINAFVTMNRGFHGVIKQRFSDFIVHEIDVDRRVVVLTDTALPVLPERAKTPVPEIPVSEEILAKLKALDDGSSTNKEGVEIDVTGNTKEERKGLHSRINEVYSSLSSTTKLKDDKTFIVAAKKSSKLLPKRSTTRWPVVIDGVENYYTTFTIYKENRETLECIYELAHKLRTEPTRFSFAGTKDRRGKTTQKMSVFRISPDALADAAQHVQRIKVGNFAFSPERTELGGLRGNKFSIILRNLVCAEPELDEIMGNLRDRGFINYYGMQRFGTHKMGTHEIGREMLKGNWEEAVDYILRPRERDDPDMQRARRVWRTRRSADEAFRCLRSRGRTIEGKLWMGLSKNKNDYKKATDALPKNIRLLYLHAYQSYIWNQVASRRALKHDLKVLAGDLVLPLDDFDIEEDELIESENFNEEDENRDLKEAKEKRHDPESDDEPAAKKEKLAKKAEEPVAAETVKVETEVPGEEKAAEAETAVKEEEKMETEEKKEEIKAEETEEKKEEIKAEETEEKKEEVKAEEKMETEEQKEEVKAEEPKVEEEVKVEVKTEETVAPVEEKKEDAAAAAIEESYHKRKRRQQPVVVTEEDVSKYTIYDIVLPLPGDEAVFPQNECAEWYKEFMLKDGVNFEDIGKKAKSYCLYGGYRRFIQRPIDLSYQKIRYNDVTQSLVQSDIDAMSGVAANTGVENGRYEALIMEFSLPSSSYATMALREAMKTETSAQHQSSLNEYYKKFIEDY